MLRLLLGIFIVASSFHSSTALAQVKKVTTFQCLNKDGIYGTVARRGQKVTAPLIVYTQSLGGFTPKERCEIVSDRLTKAVAKSGGKLTDLLLTHGKIQNSSVICYVDGSFKPCNRETQLFTLRPKDSGNKVLNELATFAQGKINSPVYQSGGNVFVKFGEAADKLLDESDGL